LQAKPDPLHGIHVALYYLALACLFTHELDAMTHSEWRLFFVFGGMSDASASTTFVALHVPFFFLVLWMSNHRSEAIRERSRLAFAFFLVLHAILHFGFSSHPEYDFHGLLSRLLILSAAGFAALFLGTRWRAGNSGDAA
jgi:hypothetical protein